MCQVIFLVAELAGLDSFMKNPGLFIFNPSWLRKNYSASPS